MLPHLAVIPLNHTVNTTRQLSLSALWLSISRTTWITWLSCTVISLVVSHDGNNGGPLKDTKVYCICGMNGIGHSYKIFFKRPLLIVEIYKSINEVEEEAKEEEERVVRAVRTLKANKLYVWGILFLILGSHSYPLQTLNCEQGPLLTLDSLQTAL